MVSIGMSIGAIFKQVGIKSGNNPQEKISQLPCNIKIIFETEEESGSHSLIEQIQENKDFSVISIAL